jgi:hypothetical protein
MVFVGTVARVIETRPGARPTNAPVRLSFSTICLVDRYWVLLYPGIRNMWEVLVCFRWIHLGTCQGYSWGRRLAVRILLSLLCLSTFRLLPPQPGVGLWNLPTWVPQIPHFREKPSLISPRDNPAPNYRLSVVERSISIG